MKESIVLNAKVGNDIGNSEHDIMINNSLIQQPNIFSRLDKLPNLDEVNPDYVIKNLEENLIVTINSPECVPSIYYIGNKALKSGVPVTNMEVGRNNDKIISDIVIVNTLAQIAGFATKETYQKNPALINEQITVYVDMATSLPVKQYNKFRADALSKRFMAGKHNVIVHVGNQRVDVDIHFQYCKVLPESVPVVFALQEIEKVLPDSDIFEEFNTNYKLNVEGEYFKGKKILHGSIGEGTTEYPITEDIEFNPDFIRGTNNGLGLAIEAAMESFIDDVHLVKYSRQKYSEALRDPGHKYHEKALEHIKKHLNSEADSIFRNLNTELEKANNEVDIILIHGGGSILMKEYLYPRLMDLCTKTYTKLFYVPEKYAVILEALGLRAFVDSQIFHSLKEKSVEKNG